MRLFVLLISACAALTACAPTRGDGSTPERASARPCFFPSQVTNFRQGDTQRVYLKVFGGDVYQVSAGACQNLDYTNALAISPAFGISERLCVGDTVRIAVRQTTVPTTPCRAVIDRKLTEAEVEALPSRQRP